MLFKLIFETRTDSHNPTKWSIWVGKVSIYLSIDKRCCSELPHQEGSLMRPSFDLSRASLASKPTPQKHIIHSRLMHRPSVEGHCYSSLFKHCRLAWLVDWDVFRLQQAQTTRTRKSSQPGLIRMCSCNRTTNQSPVGSFVWHLLCLENFQTCEWKSAQILEEGGVWSLILDSSPSYLPI